MPSAERRAPSADYCLGSTRPPSPPDRLPACRGGRSSPYTYAASAAGPSADLARPRVARRGLVRSARALAAAALLALSGALPLPAQAQTTCTLNTGDIWCAVVAVGEYMEGGSPFAYGFVETFSVGDLSDDSGDKSFTYGTNSYTVDHVTVALEQANRALSFSLTGPLTNSDRAKLVLHVGSKSFPLGTADYGSAGYDYSWLRSGLDWSSATSVTVRLRDDPPPPPTNLTASPGDRRVTLAWDAPAAAARVSSHEFRYKRRTTGDYNPWQAIPDSALGGANASGYTPPGASDDYPATGYPNLIDHVFQVRAVNAAGASGPSNEAAATPLHPKAPPAPTVRAPANTAGLLEVSWTAVASASAYEVRFWPADEDGVTFQTKWTTDTSALIWPLDANTDTPKPPQGRSTRSIPVHPRSPKTGDRRATATQTVNGPTSARTRSTRSILTKPDRRKPIDRTTTPHSRTRTRANRKPTHRQTGVAANTSRIGNLPDHLPWTERAEVANLADDHQSPVAIPATGQHLLDQRTHQPRRARQQPAVHDRRSAQTPAADQLVQERDASGDTGGAGHGPSTRDQPSRGLDADPPTAPLRRQLNQHTAITRSQVHHQIRPPDPYPFDQKIDDHSWSRAPRREADRGPINDIGAALAGHTPARDDEADEVLTSRNLNHRIHLTAPRRR